MIATIQHSYQQAEALAQLGAALAQAQQEQQAEAVWTQAQQVIGTIEDRDERAGALCELATALAQAQLWTQAQQVIGTIEDSFRRSAALRELALQLALEGKFEQVLRLIQHSWWLARTRENALNLFPIAIGLITQHPELGIALNEAFTRVDSFLKG